VNPAKTRVVVDWPTPISVYEARGFVGPCSYYWRFIEDFGENRGSTYVIVRKEQDFLLDRRLPTVVRGFKEVADNSATHRYAK